MPALLLPLLNFLRPYLAWIILAAVVVAGGFYIRHALIAQGKAEAEAARQKQYAQQYQADAEAKAKVSQALEQNLAQSRAQAVQLNGRLQNEIAKNSVYHTCIMPLSGVQLLNAALDPSGAGSR